LSSRPQATTTPLERRARTCWPLVSRATTWVK